MGSQLANLVTVVFVWGIASYIFVFGFAQIKWEGWAGGFPWMMGVIGLFVSAAFTSKWLMHRDNP